MKKVYLHGSLGMKFGKSWCLDVKSIPEALRAIDCNKEGFLDYFLADIVDTQYVILKKDAKDIKNKKDFSDNLVKEKSEAIGILTFEEIHLVPIVQGGAPVGAAISAWAVEFFTVQTLINIVIMTAISYGIAMLTKPPDPETKDIKTITSKSYVLNGAKNRAAQGIAVPIGYGRLMVGSSNIGMKIDVKRYLKNRSNDSRVLESYSSTKFLDILCEGPIEGFVSQRGEKLRKEDWEKSIFLNKVPIRGEDGRFNYILSESTSQGEEGGLSEEKLTDIPRPIGLALGEEFSASSSVVSRGINYIKEHNLQLYGPMPYPLAGSPFNETVTDAGGLISYSISKEAGAKVCSHLVKNVNVNKVTFTFQCRLSYHNIEGTTFPETCSFVILVERYNGEFNILDPENSGCLVTVPEFADNITTQNSIAASKKWEFGLDYFKNLGPLSAERYPDMVGAYAMLLLASEGSAAGQTSKKFQKTWEQFVDLNQEVSKAYKETVINEKYFSVSGIATDPFEFQIECDFAFNLDTVEINEGITFKIIKLSPELDPSVDASDNIIAGMRKVRFLSLSHIQEGVVCDMMYPHTAICSVEFDSKNFESTPERAYHVKLKKVLIPSNYDPVLRKYINQSGEKTPWNGLFKGQENSSQSLYSVEDSNKYWTDNPAWILFDLIDNPRFGVSRYGLEPGSIDKWQLFKISKYCDEFVDTGYNVETKTKIPRAFYTDNIVKYDDEYNIVDNDYGYIEVDISPEQWFFNEENVAILESKGFGRRDYKPAGLNRYTLCNTESIVNSVFQDIVRRDATSEELDDFLQNSFSVGTVADLLVNELSEDSQSPAFSPNSVFSNGDFIKEFGDGRQFAGKKIAFYSASHSFETYSEQIKRKIHKDSCLGSENKIIEERILLSSDPITRKIIVSGPNFEEDFKCLTHQGSNVSLGGCACQINHPLIEPRFSCNLYITDQLEALEALNHLTSVFRGMISYYDGKISANIDRPKKPQALFTNSNISKEGFSYAGTHKNQKYTSSLVRFNNKEKQFSSDVIFEEDSRATQVLGFSQKESIGFGITSESQARRFARWVLSTSNLELDAISFKTSLQANLLSPGSIFEVSDEMRVGKHKSGRIVDVGTEQIMSFLDHDYEEYVNQDVGLLSYWNESVEPNPDNELSKLQWGRQHWTLVGQYEFITTTIDLEDSSEISLEDGTSELIEEVRIPIRTMFFKTVERLGLSPFLILDKSLDSFPNLSRVELSVSVGLSQHSYETINDRANTEKSSFDQDAEIENISSPQLLKFDARVTSLRETGETSHLVDSTGVIDSLSLKLSFKPLVKDNRFEVVRHKFEDGSRVRFVSGGILPAGLDGDRVLDRSYFVINITDHSFQISEVANGLPVIIHDQGKDSFLNNGGDHFVCPESMTGEIDDITLESFNQIQKGSTFSISGHTDLESNSALGARLLDSANLLAIGVEGLDFVEYKSWQNSTIFGNVYISSRDWVYAEDLGWVYIKSMIEAAWNKRWGFINEIGWVFFNSSLRGWIYFQCFEGHLTINPWVYKKNEQLFITDSDLLDKKVLDYAFLGGYANNPSGKRFVIRSINGEGYWLVLDRELKEGVQTLETAPSVVGAIPSNIDETTASSNPGLRESAISNISYTLLDYSKQSVDSASITFPQGHGLEIQYNLKMHISGVDSGDPAFDALINKEWSTIYVDDNNVELVGSEGIVELLKENSFQFVDLGSATYIARLESVFSNLLPSKLYRTLSVKEVSSSEFEVSGMEYNLAKFKSIDENTPVRIPYFPIPPQADMSVPESPTLLELEDNTYRGN